MRGETVGLVAILVLVLAALPQASITGDVAHDQYRWYSQHENRNQLQERTFSVNDDIVYRYARYSINDTGWQVITLNGERIGATDWLRVTGTYTLPASITGRGEHYLITYTCTAKNTDMTSWNCHGNETEDERGSWQLRIVSNERAQEFLANGFEQGLQRPFITITENGGIATDSTYAHTGSASLRLRGYGTYHYTNPDTGTQGNIADLHGGGDVTYSAWYRGDANVQAGLMILCLNDNLNYWEEDDGYYGEEFTPTSTWQQRTITYTCPSWTEHVGVRLSVRGNGNVWYDDVTLETDGEEPICTQRTCSSLGHECGTWNDGCGSTINCGSCTAGTCVNGKCEQTTTDDYVVVYSNDFEQHSTGSYDATEADKDWNLMPEYPLVIGNAAIIQDSADTANPSKVLRNQFPQGYMNCDHSACLQTSHRFSQGYDELYFSYKVKFSTDFSLERGKLPRLGGMLERGHAGRCQTGYDGFSGTYEFAASNGDINMKNYVYHALMWNSTFYREWFRSERGYYPSSCEEVCPITDQTEGGCGVYGEGSWFEPAYDEKKWQTFFNPNIHADQWYTITQRLVLNDIGTNNGFIETFIDGRIVNRITGLEFTKTEDLKIDNILFSTYTSREPWPRNQYAWYDDIKAYHFTPGTGQPVGHQYSASNRALPNIDDGDGTCLPETITQTCGGGCGYKYNNCDQQVYCGSCGDTSAGQLVVMDNDRYLIKRDSGEAFFYLGDTAWRLLERLTKEEINTYLDARESQGFNVVMIVGHGYQLGPNAYGHRPYNNDDFSTPRTVTGPDNDFWDLLDYVLDETAKRGMYVAIVPVWGNSYTVGGDVTIDNAYGIGSFYGQRFGERENIIWVMGGDMTADSHEYVTIFYQMAQGIAAGSGKSQSDILMTYHPGGFYGIPHSSSAHLHDENWLDMNGIQSGHYDSDTYPLPNYQYVEQDYARTPAKPTGEMESLYEDIHFKNNPSNHRGDAYDARRNAYWNVFAGAYGYTFGNNHIWQFWDPDAGMYNKYNADERWEDNLYTEASQDMTHLANLMNSRPFAILRPEQDLITSSNSNDVNRVQATRADDGSYAYVYVPSRSARPSISINLALIGGNTITARWYDPRAGTYSAASTITNTQASRTFTLPTTSNQDWVLVIEGDGTLAPDEDDNPDDGLDISRTIDPNDVHWLDTPQEAIIDWPVTSTITKMTIEPEGDPNVGICIHHTKAGGWPAEQVYDFIAEGNAWVIANINGQWYADTYEWLRPGQECKRYIYADNIGGDQAQNDPVAYWEPSVGETVCFMVSTIARKNAYTQLPETERERSNIVCTEWPY